MLVYLQPVLVHRVHVADRRFDLSVVVQLQEDQLNTLLTLL